MFYFSLLVKKYERIQLCFSGAEAKKVDSLSLKVLSVCGLKCYTTPIFVIFFQNVFVKVLQHIFCFGFRWQ